MTSPAVTIETAGPDDLHALKAVQQDVLAEPSPDLLAAAVEGIGMALVARPDGSMQADHPVGYVLALTAGNVTYVPELAVIPDFQRQGIGTALLGAVRERSAAEGAQQLRLTVRADAKAARSFYRDRGFDVIERLPDHYETGGRTGLLLARPI